MNTSPSERDERIRILRAEGRSLQAVAQEVGLTRERVRQILHRIGGPTAAEVRRHVEVRRAQEVERLKSRIGSDLRAHPGSSAEEVAGRLGISKKVVQRHVPAEVRSTLVNPSGFSEQVWSDEEILEAIRTTATFAYPVSGVDYDRLLLSGEVRGPSVARIVQRFGNWGNACRCAGVEPTPPRRPHYQSKWTDEDLLAFVRDYLHAPGSSGTFAGYDPWRREVACSAPSSALLRARLGSWGDIKRKALER